MYSLASPGPEYEFSDFTHEDLRALSSQVVWSKGRQALMLFAIFVSEGQDEQALEGSFRDGMERLAGARLGEPATAQTMLGGLDCKHLQWKADDVRVDAFFLARDRTFFGLCAVDEDGTLGTEKAKLSLQLLE